MDRQTPFFRAGGTLEPGAESYIPRKADEQLLQALLTGEYVYLLDSRQKGKSSLVARTIVKLNEAGVCTAKLDLQRIGSNVTPEQWYAGLLAGIGQELSLESELLAHWQSKQAIGPLARFVGALQEVVLSRIADPLVIFIDEIDFVRALEFSTDEFFAAIRECYNRRASEAAFRRLTFCLVGVATPGQLIRNPDISPFNIGTRIDLADFSLEETSRYASSLNGNGRDGIGLVKRIQHWVGGHPYLTQLLCDRIAGNPGVVTSADVDRLVREQFLSPESRQREPNLADVERRLLDPDVPGLTPEERRVQVLEIYGRMLKSNGVEAAEQNPVVATLRLSGIGLEVGGALRVRNWLYRMVFDEDWRRKNLPDAERRRQLGAARGAMLRTAAVAGLVLLALSAASLGMWRLASDRKQALADLQIRTNDLRSVSDGRKAALTALQLRSQDLKRISSERQRALNTLTVRNKDLSQLSTERQRALMALQQRTEDLNRVSSERERTIADLTRTTNALNRQTYNAVMSGINIGITTGSAKLILGPAQHVFASKQRGWESGYLNLLLTSPQYELKVSEFSELETDSDGNLMVGNEAGLFEVRNRKLTRRMAFTIPPNVNRSLAYPYYPIRGQGNFRFWYDRLLKTCAIHEANSNRIVIPARAGVELLDIDPLGEFYLSAPPYQGENTEVIELRTLKGDRLVAAVRVPGCYYNAMFLPTGNWILAASPKVGKSEVRLMDRRASVLMKAPLNSTYEPHWIFPDRRGAHFALVSRHGAEIISTADLNVRYALPKLPMTSDYFMNVTFSPEGSTLAAGTYSGGIQLIDVATGQLLRTIYAHPTSVDYLTFISDGKHLASLTVGGSLKVWSTESAGPLEEVRDIPIQAASYFNGGKELVWWSNDGLIVSRNVGSGKTIRRKTGARFIRTSMSASSIYADQPGGTIVRIDPSSLQVLSSSKPFSAEGMVLPFKVLPRSKRLIVMWISPAQMKDSSKPIDRTREFAILDAETLTLVGRFSTPNWPAPANYSYDSAMKLIACTGNVDGEHGDEARMGRVRLLSALNGKDLGRLQLAKNIVAQSLSPDGTMILAIHAKEFKSMDSEIVLYTISGKRIGSLPYKGNLITTMKFSPDGRYFAGLNRSGECFLWEVKSRRQIAKFSDQVVVRDFNFSPDSERIVSHGRENPTPCLTVWDGRTGAELMTLPFEEGSPVPNVGQSPYFSLDGKNILHTGVDGVLRIFHGRPWKPQPKAERRYGS